MSSISITSTPWAVPYWSPTNEDLTEDSFHFDRLAFAFHIAGHSWYSWRHEGVALAVEFSPERPEGHSRFGHKSTAAAMATMSLALEAHQCAVDEVAFGRVPEEPRGCTYIASSLRACTSHARATRRVN